MILHFPEHSYHFIGKKTNQQSSEQKHPKVKCSWTLIDTLLTYYIDMPTMDISFLILLYTIEFKVHGHDIFYNISHSKMPELHRHIANLMD